MYVTQHNAALNYGPPQGRGVGARVGAFPTWKIRIFYKFATFSSCGGLFSTFFSLWGGGVLLPFSWRGSPYGLFALMGGGVGLVLPPLLKKFQRGPINWSHPFLRLLQPFPIARQKTFTRRENRRADKSEPLWTPFMFHDVWCIELQCPTCIG